METTRAPASITLPRQTPKCPLNETSLPSERLQVSPTAAWHDGQATTSAFDTADFASMTIGFEDLVVIPEAYISVVACASIEPPDVVAYAQIDLGALCVVNA
jgi:hypothetical protein